MMLAEAQLAPASAPAGTSLVDNLLQFGSAALALYQQQQLAKTNLKLAAAGQPTIPVSAVPGLAPTFQVQGGLDPATKQLLIFGALGAGALFLLTRKRGR